ncbi:hypothetical protein [Streptomyces sp. NPDC002845]
MRATVIRRTSVAAAVAAFAVLVTACGGSDSEGGDGSGEATAAAEQSAPSESAVEPLTAAELEKAALVQGDVEKYTISEPGKGQVPSQDDVTTDSEECSPLAQSLVGATVADPAATVYRQAISGLDGSDTSVDAALNVTTTLVPLSSYADADAAGAALKSLDDAVGECAGGFEGTAAGVPQKITEVAQDSAAPEGWDEALAVKVKVEQDGEPGSLKLVVVRKGASLASFIAFNAAAVVSGDDFDFPTELVDAQLAKLG